MKVVGAVLKYVGGVSDAGHDVVFAVRVSLPSGKVQVIEWRKSQNLEAEVPTEITYRDDFNNLKTFHPNYARFVLDAYGPQSKLKLLKFVREVKRAEVEEAAFAVEEPEAPISEPVKKKDKRHEDAS